MTEPGTIWGREPVAIVFAIRAVLLAGIGFGLQLEPEQLAGLMLAIEAILAVVTRSSVFAPATVARLRSQPIGYADTEPDEPETPRETL